MIAISIEEIQHDLLNYLQQVKSGETVVILQANQPIAEIKPWQPTRSLSRPFGLCQGEFVVPDDFDESLPEEIINQFEAQ
jgi:antitoxin (DNA-binding transcriptional repressor) of toxin-antitoxin stability system